MLIGIAGLIGLAFTVFYAHRAWRAADATYKAMIESERRELRAYVMNDAADLWDNENPPAKFRTFKGRPGVTIRIQNYGATPAHDVRHSAMLGLALTADEHKIVAPVPPANQSTFVMGRDSQVTLTVNIDDPLTNPQRAQIRDGLAAFYVVGLITYRDIFDVERRTTYKLRYSGVWPIGDKQTDRLFMCADGNHAS